MSAIINLGRKLPRPIKNFARKTLRFGKLRTAVKHEAELNYWKGYNGQAGNTPDTEYYRKFMMDMGGIRDVGFFKGKICLDIGCGPRGSLTWMREAKAAIGLDPLADQYHANFDIGSHAMIYLHANVEKIPLPSNYVDVVFSMNSLDHVDHPVAACQEIRRILKPGGSLIASLNLNEPVTLTEPWPLSEEFLERHLFGGWKREYYEVRPKLADDRPFGPYRFFYEPITPEYQNYNGPMALWCRYLKPVH